MEAGTHSVQRTVLSSACLVDGCGNRHGRDSGDPRTFLISFSIPCIFRREIFQNFSMKKKSLSAVMQAKITSYCSNSCQLLSLFCIAEMNTVCLIEKSLKITRIVHEVTESNSFCNYIFVVFKF